MQAHETSGRLSRRAFAGGVVGLGVSAAGLVTVAGCSLLPSTSKTVRTPLIGVLLPGPDVTDPSSRPAIRDGLREAGWIEGQTITIEWRSAEGDFDRLPGLAAELVALPVDLIATVSSPATAAAKKATSTIPIVFCGNGDPVSSGFVQSLAQPGGNLTGTTQVSTALAGKRLSLLKELVHGLTRVAFMTDLGGPGGPLQAEELRTAAGELRVEINILDVRAESDLEPTFAVATNWHADALLVGGAHHELDQEVIQLAMRNLLPALYSRNAEVEAGGLLSYGPRTGELVRRAAAYHVDRILRGAKPSELPVEQPTVFELTLNQTTALTLGLTIPTSFAAQVTAWVP
jgi:putative ABC transport system substrate-binding protein